MKIFYAISLFISEISLETTARCHHKPIRMNKTTSSGNAIRCNHCGKLRKTETACCGQSAVCSCLSRAPAPRRARPPSSPRLLPDRSLQSLSVSPPPPPFLCCAAHLPPGSSSKRCASSRAQPRSLESPAAPARSVAPPDACAGPHLRTGATGSGTRTGTCPRARKGSLPLLHPRYPAWPRSRAGSQALGAASLT